jgi:IS4 transposase
VTRFKRLQASLGLFWWTSRTSTFSKPRAAIRALGEVANLRGQRWTHWRLTGRGEAFRASIVNYADDFVILSQQSAAEALAWTHAVMTKLGLTLNGAKTSVKDAQL